MKSPSEFIELSTAHARKQFEAMTAQAKELTGLAQKVTTEIAAKDWRHGGNADLPLHRAAGLCQNGVVARPAAAPDRPAPAVEEAELDAMALAHLDQADLRLVEFLSRGDEAAILVAVGIT